MVRGACGDLDRDRGEEDWAFSAPSQVTYYMQHIVLAGVMADAAMVDAAIEADVYRRDLHAKGPRSKSFRFLTSFSRSIRASVGLVGRRIAPSA